MSSALSAENSIHPGTPLVLERIQKSFETPQGEIKVLNDFNLQVTPGEFVAVIGPSGCGKSTLLRIIAGLDTDYQGRVLLDGHQVKGPGLDRGFMFQEHRLFPWLTVEKNIAADLSLRDAATRRQVDELIELIHLSGFAKSHPKELSGGMLQRVALARALLRKPKVLLLDEPFGALDSFTRAHMQEALLDVWLRNRTTMILVTHDIDEAVVLANRVVVLKAKPSSISAVVNVDIPYPRERGSIKFEEYRRQILGALDHS